MRQKIKQQYLDRYEDKPVEEVKEKNHEARRNIVRITNLVYMINRRGEYTVTLAMSKYSVECNIVKTKDIGIKQFTRICANADNIAELDNLISDLDIYHGHNYQ